jgi:hypothetical protein
MANDLIRPIDANTAHAVEEASKAMGKAIDASVRLGNYTGDIPGNLPRDLVGLVGDWVVHKRVRRVVVTVRPRRSTRNEIAKSERSDAIGYSSSTSSNS